MNKRDHLYLGCFLNRMAIYCSCNPLKADPIRVLKDHFDFEEPNGHIDAFDDFCFSALKDNYSWDNGSPGNSTYYGERLELLVEATYLIHNKHKKYNLTKKPIPMISVKDMPMLLSPSEFKNPLMYFEKFFEYCSLSHWKKIIVAFTNASISNFSVTDEIEPTETLQFYSRIQKLFYAAARLVELLEKDIKT